MASSEPVLSSPNSTYNFNFHNNITNIIPGSPDKQDSWKVILLVAYHIVMVLISGLDYCHSKRRNARSPVHNRNNNAEGGRRGGRCRHGGGDDANGGNSSGGGGDDDSHDSGSGGSGVSIAVVTPEHEPVEMQFPDFYHEDVAVRVAHEFGLV